MNPDGASYYTEFRHPPQKSHYLDPFRRPSLVGGVSAEDDQGIGSSHHVSSSSAGNTSSSYGWTFSSSNTRSSQRSQKSSQTSLHSWPRSPSHLPERKLSVDSMPHGFGSFSRPPTRSTRSNTSRGTHSGTQTASSSHGAASDSAAGHDKTSSSGHINASGEDDDGEFNIDTQNESTDDFNAVQTQSSHPYETDDLAAPGIDPQSAHIDDSSNEVDHLNAALLPSNPRRLSPHDVAERSEKSVYTSPSSGNRDLERGVTLPAENGRDKSTSVSEQLRSQQSDYAQLEAVHLADLQERGYYVYDDTVWVTRNGCEAVFLPKPALNLSSQLSDRQTHVSGTINKCWTSQSLEDVRRYGSEVDLTLKRATFERNRRPSRVNLQQAMYNSKSTPNLVKSREAHGDEEEDEETQPALRGEPTQSRDALAVPSNAQMLIPRGLKSSSQPALRRVIVQSPVPDTPSLDTDHGTASPQDSLDNDEDGARHFVSTTRFDMFDAFDDSDGLSRDDLLERIAALENERQGWRREFSRSIEGRGRRTAEKEKVPAPKSSLIRSRSKSRARRSQGDETRAEDAPPGEETLEGERQDRIAVFSAGPQTRWRMASRGEQKRLEFEAKERHEIDSMAASANGLGSPKLRRRARSTVHLRSTDMTHHGGGETGAVCLPVGVSAPTFGLSSRRKSISKDIAARARSSKPLSSLLPKRDSGPIVLPPTSSDRDLSSSEGTQDHTSVIGHGSVQASRSGSVANSHRNVPSSQDGQAGNTSMSQSYSYSSGTGVQSRESGMLHPSMQGTIEDAQRLRRRSAGASPRRSSPPRTPAPERPLPAIPSSDDAREDVSSLREDLLPEVDQHMPFEGMIAGLGLYSESVGDLNGGGSIKADSIIEPRRGVTGSSSTGHVVGDRSGGSMLTPKSSVQGSLRMGSEERGQ